MRNPEIVPPPLAERAQGRPCNANVADLILPGELDHMKIEIASHCASILRALGIDYENDHNSVDTPERMAKMFVDEVFAGRFQPAPEMTDFPNALNLDEIVIVGPTHVRSTCAHHFCPVMGHAIVGVIPGEKIIGLSKFARMATWVMSRPQIQEEATVQLANEIEDAIKPRGLGVVVTCSHSCMTWRGVKESESVATTSVMRGIFKEDPRARLEFLSLMERNHK